MSELSGIVAALRQIAKDFQNWVDSIDWKKVSEIFKFIQNELPEKIEKLFVQLANKGWFVWDMEKPLGSFVKTLSSIMDKDYEDQEHYLASYIEAETDYIQAKLLASHPDRETQINDAFGAHKAGLFGASIPTEPLINSPFFGEEI